MMGDAKMQSKLFYRIEEVSRLAKLDPETIESWEKECPLIQPGATGAGRKIFRAKDVEIILRIKELLDKKSLTLAGAKRKIEEEFGFKPAQPPHPDRLIKVLWQVRGQLQDLAQELEKRSKKA
jgi:DNA-binding transcriptional MerR regulator